jgi:hypothetical protein
MKIAAIACVIVVLGLAGAGAAYVVTGPRAQAVVPPCQVCANREMMPCSTPAPAPAPVLRTNAPLAMAQVAQPDSNAVLAAQQLADMSVLVAQLRADAAGLQARLAEMEAERDALKDHSRSRREGMQARMERMKAEEPERYQEMQEQRASFSERIRVAHLERTEFLASLDTDSMTEEQFAAHSELIQRLDEMAEVTTGFAEGRFPSREERGKLRESFGAVKELYEVEREFVLQEIGRDLGMNETESNDFGTYMGSVYEMTSLQRPSRHGRPSATPVRQD